LPALLAGIRDINKDILHGKEMMKEMIKEKWTSEVWMKWMKWTSEVTSIHQCTSELTSIHQPFNI